MKEFTVHAEMRVFLVAKIKAPSKEAAVSRANEQATDCVCGTYSTGEIDDGPDGLQIDACDIKFEEDSIPPELFFHS